MTSLTLDARIKFNQTVLLPGPTAIVSASVIGGAIILLQVGVFDAQDSIIDGVGIDGFGGWLSSEETGTASWLFMPKPATAYVKWGVVALRSAAGLGRYSVTGKIRNANGDALAIGQFSGEIPAGKLNDDLVYDGVMVRVDLPVVAMLAGAVL